MLKTENSGNARYQLRYAAGLYWLLDMRQEGVPYRKPLPMNEIGADIWRMMEQGMEKPQIADALCGEYLADRQTVLGDIEQFQKQLLKQGIISNG